MRPRGSGSRTVFFFRLLIFLACIYIMHSACSLLNRLVPVQFESEFSNLFGIFICVPSILAVI